MTTNIISRKIFCHTAALLTLAIVAVFPTVSISAAVIWTDVSLNDYEPGNPTQKPTGDERFRSYRSLAANLVQLRAALSAAAMDRDASTQPATMTLPMPDGGQADFHVTETPVMEVGLAAKYPQIRTYKVRAVADASVTGRIDFGPHGFHAFLVTAEGSVFIDPAATQQQDVYVSYFKRDYPGRDTTTKHFSCGVDLQESQSSSPTTNLSLAKTTTSHEILVYRLAAAATGEYSQAVAGGNATNTLAEIVTAINRISRIFERDLGVRMLLVANNDSLIYTDAATDPYTNRDLDALLV